MYYVKYEGIEFRFQASKSEPVGSKTTGLGGSEINRQSENDSYSGGKGGNLVPVVDPLSLNREGEKKISSIIRSLGSSAQPFDRSTPILPAGFPASCPSSSVLRTMIDYYVEGDCNTGLM